MFIICLLIADCHLQWLSSHKTVDQSITYTCFGHHIFPFSIACWFCTFTLLPMYLPYGLSSIATKSRVASLSQHAAQSTMNALYFIPFSSWWNFKVAVETSWILGLVWRQPFKATCHCEKAPEMCLKVTGLLWSFQKWCKKVKSDQKWASNEALKISNFYLTEQWWRHSQSMIIN